MMRVYANVLWIILLNFFLIRREKQANAKIYAEPTARA